MEIRETHKGQVTILEARGLINYQDGDNFFQDYLEDCIRRGRIRIVLDLTQVSEIDHAGAGELIRIEMRLLQAGGGLKLLAEPNSPAIEFLEYHDLLRLFQFYVSLDSAISGFVKDEIDHS